MFELGFTYPRSIGNKSVLVLECPNLFFVNVSTFKTYIREFWLCETIRIEVSINSWNTFFVRAVEFSDSIPNLSLDLKIIFEIIDDFVVLLHFGAVMILVKL